ncbi:hypothetical protein ACFQX6_22510 [Streptosporangium lutulentum]
MRIVEVLTQPVRTGFFADDQAAIRAGAEHDGFAYSGIPITPGFSAIRQAGEALSVLLLLEDGSVAHGDCAAVQYSGAGGRDPLFSAEAARRDVEEHLRPLLVGAELGSFRELAGRVDACHGASGPLHTAIRYGVTQAVLDAVAQSRGSRWPRSYGTSTRPARTSSRCRCSRRPATTGTATRRR